MRDAQRSNFERRLARIDRIHDAGGAFEATGALGRAYFDSHRPRERKPFPWRPLAMVFGGVVLFKGAILAQIGTESYAQRVEALMQGNLAEQLGGWVLRADTPTQWIATQLHGILF